MSRLICASSEIWMWLSVRQAPLSGIEILLKHISNRLQSRKFCVVFEGELGRIWPTEKKETTKRAAAIQAFAARNGLSAKVHDPGVRVTFRKIAS
jgi:hypothetical protein